MKVVITGGIGAGKSYVCKWLKAQGIDIYDCDAAAKRLMRSSVDLQQALINLVGNDVYYPSDAFVFPFRELNKGVLAQYLLSSKEHAQAINDIVHPAVADDFSTSGFDWMECAIYFDSGFNQRVHVDKVVCVTAPDETRIARIMQRDGITYGKAQEWLGRQLPQDEVMRRSDYVVVNDGVADLHSQLRQLLVSLQESSKNQKT